MHKTVKDFSREFEIFAAVIKKSERFLLVAHKHPDPDTVGANVALARYLRAIGKKAEIMCEEEFPDGLKVMLSEKFLKPDEINFASYDVMIGCDSIERTFVPFLKKNKLNKTVTVTIDHHLDTPQKTDITMIDPSYSSSCEIVYDFLSYTNAKITRDIATALLIGILGDTGNLQHANTTTKVIETAEDLMRKGASPGKIVKNAFANKQLSTFHLWGRAIEKAKIVEQNGMIVTALTEEDMKACKANPDDVKQVASILVTVPDVKFSLFLFQIKEGWVKASMRSEEGRGVNVADIARKFGGGGHKLASGFEIPGHIIEKNGDWEVV
ncbi:MAG: bifunctional oligoribonuclease/PAP phosphatase NrnA [Candidatus Moranbacteria bacterium]|nr:bifunctional oligoribonuclease/PAP phosphatase NrnA [Candidatus Moranbacteria bacterium]